MSDTAPQTTKLRKKKVSFDIDPNLLERIKIIVNEREIKLADFFREAAENKLKHEEKYMIVYVFLDRKGIQKLTIERGLYDIRLKEASREMKRNVGAVHEGELEVKSEEDLEKVFDSKEIELDEDGPRISLERYIDTTLQELFEGEEIVYFFTKTRY